MDIDLPKKIKEELEEKIKDLPEELKEKIRQKVKEKYLQSLIDPYEPVGAVAAQSLGEPATQAILRAFHFIGISELQLTTGGLPRLIEIFDAKKEPSTPTMRIYLKEPYNKDLEKAKEVAMKIKETRLGDLISEIITDLAEMCLIIYFDKKKLETHFLTLTEIISVMKKSKSYVIVDQGENWVKIKPRKENITLKDLYVLKQKIKETLVKGIEGIKDVIIVWDDKNQEYVLLTYGSNLKEVMEVDEVDETRVYTNNIKEIEEVLGIEAAREAIVREAMAVFEEQGLDVDIRHILLLADLMTWSGEVKGCTRYGLIKEKPSVLARAAFEVPIKQFVNSALIKDSDKLLGVIENVMLNQIIPLGTGRVKLVYVHGEGTGESKEST